mmetsp:Transcript_95203/g.165382  ORF Transcript_95203/g.165382 Transcript_95203/m.165382 type:complete len:238 (-) Transcript_95203:3053-3766(-)
MLVTNDYVLILQVCGCASLAARFFCPILGLLVAGHRKLCLELSNGVAQEDLYLMVLSLVAGRRILHFLIEFEPQSCGAKALQRSELPLLFEVSALPRHTEGGFQLLKPALAFRWEARLIGPCHDVKRRLLEFIVPFGIPVVPNNTTSCQWLLSPAILTLCHEHIVTHPSNDRWVAVPALCCVRSPEMDGSLELQSEPASVKLLLDLCTVRDRLGKPWTVPWSALVLLIHLVRWVLPC